MRYLWTSLIAVLSEFKGSSLFTKLESSTIHRRKKIPDILCACHKVSSWQSMQNPMGERLLKFPQLAQHKSSTTEVQGKVNKWYRASLSRSWRIRNWPQSSAAVQLHYASSATVQAIFISNSDYERLRTSVVKEHIMHAWSAFALSLLIE